MHRFGKYLDYSLMPLVLFVIACGICGNTYSTICEAAPVSRPTITGQVSDSSGAPLEQARVLIYTASLRKGVDYLCPSCYADCAKSATTDTRGHFQISSVDPQLVFRLLVLHPGFNPTFVDHVDPAKSRENIDVTLPASQTVDADHMFAGKVLGPLGAPVAGATVEPVGIDGPAGMFEGTVAYDGSIDPLAVTDQNGSFVLHVKETPAKVMVLVKARGLAPVVTPFLPTTSPASIQLADGATLTGSVMTRGGKPLSGLQVRISATDTDMTKFTGFTDIGTDSMGHFVAYNLPPNTRCAAYVRMDIGGRWKSGAAEDIVTTAGDDSAIKLPSIQLEAASTVMGRISLSDGAAIPTTARIILARAIGFDTNEIAVQSDGSYSLCNVPRSEKMSLLVCVPHYHVAKDTPGLNANPYDPEVDFTTSSTSAPNKIDVVMIPDEIKK